MKINLEELNFPVKADISERLMEDWLWLIGKDKKVILISIIGDMFLESNNGNIFWLDIGDGKLHNIASDQDEFNQKLKDIELVNEWFMIDLANSLLLSNKKLKEGQVYSYKKLPIIGGEYAIENFEPMDIEVHFSIAGQIHKQIKDLPDGTMVKIKFHEEKKNWFKRLFS